MSYTPAQDIFVNGEIADANDVLNEFVAISAETQRLSAKSLQDSTKALDDSKQYTDTALADLVIDGGTF